MKDRWTLEKWLKIDYLDRYCPLHEAEVRRKLSLWPRYQHVQETTSAQIFDDFIATYGETPDRAMQELSRRLGLDESFSDRFLMTAQNRDIKHVISAQISYNPYITLPEGISIARYWPYSTPDGQSIFGFIVSITDGVTSVKLPLTIWEKQLSLNIHYDFLSWPQKFPLFRLDRLPSSKIVCICQGEEEVEKAEQEYRGELNNGVMFTTWPGGFDFTLSKADWGLLQGKRVAIVPAETREGYQLGQKVADILANIDCEFAGFMIESQRATLKSFTQQFQKKIGRDNEINNGTACVSEHQFARVAYEKFGIGQPIEPEDLSDTLESFLNEPDEPEDWVIPQLIGQGERVMVYAKAKEGKTTFLLQAAVMIALNGKKVLYFDAEMPSSTSKKHLKKAIKGRSIPSNFQFISASKKKLSLNFEKIENKKRWKNHYTEADVIILDNLNKMFPTSLGTDPSSSRELDEFVDELWQARKTVFLVHHANQGGRLFGTSKKTYSLDLTLKIEKGKGFTKITPEEVRSLSDGFTRPFRIAFDEKNGLSEDWFTPEKRYLFSTETSLKNGKNTTKTNCHDNIEIDDNNLISIEKINSPTTEMDKKTDSVVPEDLAKNVPREPAENIRKPSKATLKRAQDKESARRELQKNPNISARALAELLECSHGKAGDLLKELKTEQ